MMWRSAPQCLDKLPTGTNGANLEAISMFAVHLFANKAGSLEHFANRPFLIALSTAIKNRLKLRTYCRPFFIIDARRRPYMLSFFHSIPVKTT